MIWIVASIVLSSHDISENLNIGGWIKFENVEFPIIREGKHQILAKSPAFLNMSKEGTPATIIAATLSVSVELVRQTAARRS